MLILLEIQLDLSSLFDNSIGTSIGEIFFDGFDIFTLISSESSSWFPSKSLTLTRIVFVPLENGEISISNFAFSVNSIVLKP